MDFFTTLVRYEVELWAAIDDELVAAGGIRLAELQALSALHAHGTSGRVQDLSAEIGITIGAASKFVDRLERAGYVVRQPHPTDRRSSLIALTDAGTAAMTAAARVRASALSALVDEEAAADALRSLQRLQERLDDARKANA